ncbi:DUF1353 domain-containing protein [Mesorhizobium sp. M0579]|uniref:DUF1353 domain-containing protein n=1 Tax=Mesorhizobium sp. M0579 TaxID=2956962 RepID=UPI0033379D2E
MKVLIQIFTAFMFSCGTALAGGSFEGSLILLPKDCQKTDKRICRLGAPLRYTSPGGKLVWQADKWTDGNGESGTTDGASIPEWAQRIIGDPYDPSYLKAAIIHDHYCYLENHVRSWRDTDRMFYDALLDLHVAKAKAKIMYYAVYLGGPHWVDLVPGQNCGTNCINNVAPGGVRFEGDQFGGSAFQAELQRVKELVEADDDISVEKLEQRAESQKPGDFFFAHGSTYSPTGPDDPNIHPQM